MNLLSQIQRDFENYLSQNQFHSQPKELYEPANYILNLGGKRLRPSVLLLACNLYSDDYSKAMPAAYAVELFHNFTLVHDDIMDKAEVRRGEPTVHVKYSVNTGILSGDVMLVQAYNCLLQLQDVDVKKIMEEFIKFSIEVCEGQQMDMNFEVAHTITIADYIKMITLKTSVLVAGAMKVGALIGGADDSDANALYEFGKNIGIAFQLQDDLLDAYGDPEKFGKKKGGDIIQNKKTFLYLKALELADVNECRLLERLYSGEIVEESEKIRKVMQVFDKYDIKSHTEQIKTHYQQIAMSALDRVEVSGTKKAGLKDFANLLMSRQS